MEHTDLTQTRAMFWVWLGLITVGLAVMIVLPLVGR